MNGAPVIQNRLRAAVNSVEVSPYLEARVRANLRSQASPRAWSFKLGWAGVAAAVCLGLTLAYQDGHFRYTKNLQIAYIRSVSTSLVNLMRPGMADHIICSVYRKYPKNAPAVEVLARKLPAEYHDLIPIVQAGVPQDYKLLISHQCRFDGRRFVHLSLENDSHVLSLVITARISGENFRADGLLPALMQSDLAIYQATAARFAIAAFETEEHLVYFVSDLPEEENTRMLKAMTPSMQDLMKKLES